MPPCTRSRPAVDSGAVGGSVHRAALSSGWPTVGRPQGRRRWTLACRWLSPLCTAAKTI